MQIAWDDPGLKRDPQKVAGDFVREHAAWTWWCTLTFSQPVSQRHADDTFRMWVKDLARRHVREHIRVAWTVEPKNGTWHLHAVLGMPPGAPLTVRELEWVWRGTDPASAGHTDIRRYDPMQGAAYYLVKSGEWEINVACSRPPQCRRSRCVQAPGAW